MYCWLLIIFGCIVGCFDLVISTPQNDPYEVVGVECALNEEVSCLIIKCPTGRYCPAENFCYNPKCVCRRGYRRSAGVCVKKHATHKDM